MKLISTSLIAAGVVLTAAPAQADDVQTRIYLDQLPPSLRRQAFDAPVDRYGPFGVMAPNGCRWSRQQILTTQGPQWVAEERCDNQESGGR
jgi:hypothetical protein